MKNTVKKLEDQIIKLETGDGGGGEPHMHMHMHMEITSFDGAFMWKIWAGISMRRRLERRCPSTALHSSLDALVTRCVLGCTSTETEWVRAHTCPYSLLSCVVHMTPSYRGHSNKKSPSSSLTKPETNISLTASVQIPTAPVSKGPQET